MLKTVFAATLAIFCLGGAALAQETDNAPPQNAKKLSEIVAAVEQRSGFRYISDVVGRRTLRGDLLHRRQGQGRNEVRSGHGGAKMTQPQAATFRLA